MCFACIFLARFNIKIVSNIVTCQGYDHMRVLDGLMVACKSLKLVRWDVQYVKAYAKGEFRYKMSASEVFFFLIKR